MVKQTEALLARIGASARARRWRMLLERFPDLGRMRVLDLGGEVASWERAPVRPGELVTLNLGIITQAERDVPWATRIVGDACDPPGELRGERFDLVYCNSVIEHVGGHNRRIALADSVHTFGDHHWVQTPYRYFPFEPHAKAPLLQFLPPAARARAVRWWPIGRQRTYSAWPQTSLGEELHPVGPAQPLSSVDGYHAVRGALSIELLSATEMRFLFPSSTIEHERVCGITKSLIATR
jgi:hypothetical protein